MKAGIAVIVTPEDQRRIQSKDFPKTEMWEG